MKTALVLRLGGLGDLLVALPSIRLLRSTISPCSITLICREEYGLVLKETGVVDDLVSSSRRSLAPLYDRSFCYDRELACWLEKFSLILGWMQKAPPSGMKRYCFSSEERKWGLFVFDPDQPFSASEFFF